MLSKSTLSVAVVLLAFTSLAATATELKTHKQVFSYAVGFQIAQGLKRDKIDIDRKAFNQAVEDVLKGAKPRLTPQEMQAALDKFRQDKIQEQMALAKKNAEASSKFLAANKKKKGVVTLPSGVQYNIIKEGSGPRPKSTDTVTVNYRGSLLNGKEFDSSFKRGQPAELKVDSVIKGWQEILPLMKVGSKWHVVIPADQAYGDRGAGNVIGPDEALVFDIDLLSIKK